MKIMGKRDLTIIIFLIIFTGLTVLFNYLPSISHIIGKNELKTSDFNLQTSDDSYINPFIIDDYGGGNYTWAEAILQPWCSGSGTSGDPYIIENISINGKDLTSCIEIRNSNAYVKIQQCTITNAGYSRGMLYAGIKLNNTNNVQMIDNWFYLNIGHALVLYNSNYTILSENLFEDNGHDLTSYHNGICFYYSHNNFITGNRVLSTAYDGFDITDCEILQLQTILLALVVIMESD